MCFRIDLKCYLCLFQGLELYSSGVQLLEHFEISGDISEIESAVQLLEKAVELTAEEPGGCSAVTI